MRLSEVSSTNQLERRLLVVGPFSRNIVGYFRELLRADGLELQLPRFNKAFGRMRNIFVYPVL
jgi:hypothetical protein